MTRRFTGMAAVTAGALLLATGAEAQTLGTLRWQLQPYCNVLTVTVVQDGSQYHVDGTDDLCGAARRASVVGLAFPNPDGSIGFGLTTVTAPGGTPIHVDATISIASISGTWRDSAGNSGAFVFTPDAATGGGPRPVPAGGIAAGSITAAQLAPGAVAGVVAGFGSCPAGQYLRGVTAAGAVVCEPFATPPRVTPADPRVASGSYSRLAIGRDGLPVIAYQDQIAQALRVTHCGNPSCTTNNVATTVDDPAAAVGTDLAIVIGADGMPIISHNDGTAQALRVTHCGNLTCTAGNVSTLVDDPADAVGRYTAIAIGRDGLPLISHQDVTLSRLRVTHCGNASCTAGNTSVLADTLVGAGAYTSIAIGADGLPVIGHFDFNTQSLRVTHCGNASCSAGNVSTPVDDPADDVGLFTSLAIGADGWPVIAHLNGTTRALLVTHCLNSLCTSAASIDADAPPASAGSSPYSFGTMTSLAIGQDGLPVISHVERFNSAAALRVTHCGNVACSVGNVASTVDNATGSAGYYSSIAIGVDGLPVISHYDVAAARLRVASCGSRTCQ